MRMRSQKEGLTIPAEGSVELKPLSYHLMLEQLSLPLKVGERVSLTLTFDGAPDMQVVSVDSMEARRQDMKHDH